MLSGSIRKVAQGVEPTEQGHVLRTGSQLACNGYCLTIKWLTGFTLAYGEPRSTLT